MTTRILKSLAYSFAVAAWLAALPDPSFGQRVEGAGGAGAGLTAGGGRGPGGGAGVGGGAGNVIGGRAGSGFRSAAQRSGNLEGGGTSGLDRAADRLDRLGRPGVADATYRSYDRTVRRREDVDDF